MVQDEKATKSFLLHMTSYKHERCCKIRNKPQKMVSSKNDKQ